MGVRARFTTWDFVLQGTLSQLGEGLLASHGQRLGMLLTPYCTQDSLPNQITIWPKMSTVTKLRNPGLKEGKLQVWEVEDVSRMRFGREFGRDAGNGSSG